MPTEARKTPELRILGPLGRSLDPAAVGECAAERLDELPMTGRGEVRRFRRGELVAGGAGGS